MGALIETENLERYLHDSLDILRNAIEQYHAEKIHFYRVAALQLRLLLCDTTRRHGKSVDIALIPSTIPDIELPSVWEWGDAQPVSNLLPLREWLQQPIPGAEKEPISIQKFIRIICDQDGGAHIDPKPNTHLTSMPHRAATIIAIGNAVLEGVSCWMDILGSHPGSSRKY